MWLNRALGAESSIWADTDSLGCGRTDTLPLIGDVATFVGQGVGTIKKDGAVSYRGAVYYQSSSPRWSRLNSVAAIFEYEVDTQVNTRAQLWEWK